jgi:hypothetical protein
MWQTEYARIEVAADRERNSLQAQLQVAREKAGELPNYLDNAHCKKNMSEPPPQLAGEYERLEIELDSAVISAGDAEAAVEAGGTTPTLLDRARAAGPDSGSVAPPPLLMTGSLGMSLAAGVPTSARRRLRQTILLAKELNRSQAEASELRRLLAEARVDAEDLRSADAAIRAQLDAVTGPQVRSDVDHAIRSTPAILRILRPFLQEYLIAQLRAREVELKRTQAALEAARAEAATARSAVQHVEAGRRALEDELQRLVAGRSEVGALAELVKVRV